MCGTPLAGQVCAPVATPSQYWVITPDHFSLLVPMPFNSFCTRTASPAVSLLKCMNPLLSVVIVPHWLPQNTMYASGAPIVTPMPSLPPRYVRLLAEAAATPRRVAFHALICAAASVSGTAP